MAHPHQGPRGTGAALNRQLATTAPDNIVSPREVPGGCAGARDKLIHAYFDVDWRIVWNILQSEIPALEQSVRSILNDIESS
jgi:hypothetical protein